MGLVSKSRLDVSRHRWRTLSCDVVAVGLGGSVWLVLIYRENLVLCFFSSRRRHTRYWRDWSSDVCSSDLPPADGSRQAHLRLPRRRLAGVLLMAGLAATLTLLWTTSDRSGVTPRTTERGQTPITALGEQPPARQAEPVLRKDTSEAVSGPAPSAASPEPSQTGRPGDNASPAGEDGFPVPDAAATPGDNGDGSPRAGLEATPTQSPTQQPTPASSTPAPQSTPAQQSTPASSTPAQQSTP